MVDSTERIGSPISPTGEDNSNLFTFKSGFNELYEELNKSGEVDILGMRRVFRDWNNKNVLKFDEDDDPYLALVDDFFSRCGSFEANTVARGGKFDANKEKEMAASIETQRELIQRAISCVDFDKDNQVFIAEDKKNDYERLRATMAFLDRVANELMQKESTRSRTSNVKSYVSGLRSMVCAALLAKANGFMVDFAEVVLDVKYDLDLILKKKGVIWGLDVTTSQELDTSKGLGFVWTGDDVRSRVPNSIKAKNNINHLSRLVLPSTLSHPGQYAKRGGIVLGIPSPDLIANFNKVAVI